MVEKIIINPNKVRGYGNIMSPHSSTDYELSDCTITETTDTVNGATETVYELEDTILFFDPCRTDANKSSGYYVVTGSYSLSDTGLTINASTYASSNYQANIRLDNNVYTVPFEVSFELIDPGNDLFTLNFHNTSFSNSSVVAGNIWDDPQGEVTFIKFTVTSDQITRTINGSTTNLNPSSVASEVGCRFGYWRTSQSAIKIRNYKVKKIVE